MQSVLSSLLAILLLMPAATSAAESESGFFNTGGGKLWFQTCGSGAPLVLLHDGLIGAATWDGVWKDLCTHFRVVRYDRRGFGRSDRAMARHSPRDDLFALLRSLNVSHATIAAVSSGSGLAVDFAIERPAMVDRLILIGPVLHGMYESPDIDARGAALNSPLRRGNVDAVASNWAADPTTIERDDVAGRRTLHDDLVRFPGGLIYGGQNEIRMSPPAALRLSEIRVPTLILVGKDDHPDVHAFAGALENGIAGARRLLVSGAAHLVQIDQPRRLVRAIVRYVAATPVVHVRSADIAGFAGKYYAPKYDPEGSYVVIALDGGRLLLEAPAEPRLPLWPAGAGTFYMQAGPADVSIQFVRDGRHRVFAILREGDAHTKWLRESS